LYLKKFNPTTNGVRHKLQVSSYFLNFKSLKFLRSGFKKNSGRNLTGRITVNHKANYTSRLHTHVDMLRKTINLGVVIALKKDCSRGAFMALIKFSNGSYAYTLAPHGCINGMIYQTIVFPELFSTNYKVGYNVILKNLQSRSIFFNIEIKPGHGGKFSRSAGTYCVLINNDLVAGFSKIRLPSLKIITISSYCLVTLGRCSNVFKQNTVIGNAGYNVRKGYRPTVRGVAMNPVDHPHGGRTKTNSPEVTPWGKVAKRGK
jgi:large subunit ribosomal protein L2